jgi:hypothetical protein
VSWVPRLLDYLDTTPVGVPDSGGITAPAED